MQVQMNQLASSLKDPSNNEDSLQDLSVAVLSSPYDAGCRVSSPIKDRLFICDGKIK